MWLEMKDIQACLGREATRGTAECLAFQALPGAWAHQGAWVQRGSSGSSVLPEPRAVQEHLERRVSKEMWGSRARAALLVVPGTAGSTAPRALRGLRAIGA